MPKWIRKWDAPSFTNLEKTYTVSVADDGVTWGCACWPWRKTRQDCKHIHDVKNNPRMEPKMDIDPILPSVIPSKEVNKPIYDKTENFIFVPLIPLEPYDVHMEATICYFLLEHGFTMPKIRTIRSLRTTWTKKSIVDHVKTNGLKEYKAKYTDEEIKVPKSTIERFKSLNL
jgi:hypothetical protein